MRKSGLIVGLIFLILAMPGRTDAGIRNVGLFFATIPIIGFSSAVLIGSFFTKPETPVDPEIRVKESSLRDRSVVEALLAQDLNRGLPPVVSDPGSQDTFPRPLPLDIHSLLR